ncbi:MAG: UTP--glucose-1-phosphate uridylyltransferase [uncultured Nocardioidaceae bacterium]|uniref:UTP--glucose-1-phosphate uridylyltransferase n=1 Tax=uncultured Nocardioidaceae bacterium TaxID=253824 RepID=A0A6J4ME52_9ACTN|nr:MAG: UTP--glucose-1-phosphate uridylyltransferase [uncultured Nocardioidaceae bacterium]
MSEQGRLAAVERMREAGVAERAITVFEHYYGELERGATGTIAETDIEPLSEPERLTDVEIDADEARKALAQTAIIKLNGGLGTSMGLDRAKSLLTVRDGATFLDLIARQVLHVRKQFDVQLPLLLMNSFRTREDSIAALSGYDPLPVDGLPLDFLQNREPKLLAADLTPVDWPADPMMEWCPPGHGDLYTALETSGVLHSLLEAGYRYANVSNSDNLGAAPNATLAGWFARSGAPYAAEVCDRTPADRKGGHLAHRRSDGQLILRETAQVAAEDEPAYSDLDRHPYFHTNNLWFDLRALADTLAERGGVLGLPLIRNVKTVDPADSSSPEVVQIETAMGAGIGVFPGAAAIAVERSRFLPVKTTNDLLLVRSDVYALGEDSRLERQSREAPLIDLDSAFYKLVGGFEQRFSAGAPSLRAAESLTVRGDWTFGAGVRATGAATLDPPADEPVRVPDGAVVGPNGITS